MDVAETGGDQAQVASFASAIESTIGFWNAAANCDSASALTDSRCNAHSTENSWTLDAHAVLGALRAVSLAAATNPRYGLLLAARVVDPILRCLRLSLDILRGAAVFPIPKEHISAAGPVAQAASGAVASLA